MFSTFPTANQIMASSSAYFSPFLSEWMIFVYVFVGVFLAVFVITGAPQLFAYLIDELRFRFDSDYRMTSFRKSALADLADSRQIDADFELWKKAAKVRGQL